jgi:hypothetical protein
MRVNGVVVLHPAIDENKSRSGIRDWADPDIVALEGFHEKPFVLCGNIVTSINWLAHHSLMGWVSLLYRIEGRRLDLSLDMLYMACRRVYEHEVSKMWC